MNGSVINSGRRIIIIFSLFISLFSHPSVAQTCITDDADLKNPWPSLSFAGVAGDYVRVHKVGDGDDAWHWLDDDFSIDIWVLNTYNWASLANTYSTIWKAGYIDDIRRNMHLVFTRATGDLVIKVSDGAGGGNTDIVYSINQTEYENNYLLKWVHLTVTWEKGSGDAGTVKLFINGVKPGAGEQYWQYFYDIGVSTTLVIGSTGQTGKGFRGLLSGYRLWEEIALSGTEIKYIKDRSFCDTSSFNSTYANLYDHLTVNMITTEDTVFSLNGGSPDALAHRVYLEENTDLDRTFLSPGGPFPPGDITVLRECNSIRIDWNDYTEEATGYGASHDVIRIHNNDTLLLCTTNDNYYVDSANLVPGQQYTYAIRSKWLQPNYGWIYPRTILFSRETAKITSSVKTLPVPNNFRITADASSGNCLGEVKLAWDQVESATAYAIKYRIGAGDWIPLSEPSSTSYTHMVDPDELGQILTYKIDATGDDECELRSPEIFGMANSICLTKPTNLLAVADAGNIKITWDFAQSGAPATGFIIWRKTGATGLWEKIATNIPVNTIQFIDNDATMCTGYYYKVMASNSCGESPDANSDPTSEVTIPVQFDNVFEHPDAFFDASKGYFNTKVALEWHVNPAKLSDIRTFEIYRKDMDAAYYSLVETITNKNATYWEDKSVEANTMFMYKIRATGICNATEVISDSLLAIGFRTNTGIISGKVTYEGGNAVEGVEIRVKSEGMTRAKSINFDGIDDNMISVKSLSEMGSLHTGPLSVECWIRPGEMSPGVRNYIFTSLTDTLYLCLRNGRPFAEVYSNGIPKTIEADTILQSDTWYHLSLNFNPAGFLELYLNGIKVGSNSFTTIVSWSTPGDTIMIGGHDTYFKGNIDEVRIWNRFRTAEEIKRDYTRLMAGNETGLVAYWRFNEGVGSFAYDISKTGELFHKNDLRFSGGASPGWSDMTPGFEQLHPSGVTDAFGNYVINGIAYSGTGNIFSATPILGIHKFDPSDLNLFIGDNSPVHNSINFIDKSSFRFTGTVKYKNTDFPVKEASVFIDNKQVFDAGGHPVLTNDDGEFDIQVPIGQHYISVKKDKHFFTSNGQWPAPTEFDPYKKFNFQDNVLGVQFRDETTVTVAGRFVGGDREGNKVLGFDKSKNNIGTGTIKLKNEKGYDIDLTSSESSNIQYNTRNASGEYEMKLLPEQYTIESVNNANYTMSQDDLGVLDLTTIPDIIVEADSIDTYSYHFKRNFIYYAQPQISVYGSNEKPFAGDEEIIFLNPETGGNDTIDLASAVSPFLYPVFSMGSIYDIDIRVHEVYLNDTIEDIVPVEKADVTITNNLDMHGTTYNLETNISGKVADYTSFRVGMPNMTKDTSNMASYTKTISITARTKKYDVSWNDGNVFRAYILGVTDAGGANFVTYGPELTRFILRDPPGSNSYAYLKEGSTFTMTQEYSTGQLDNTVYDNKLMLGTKFEAGGGLAGPVFSTDTYSDFSVGIETSTYVDNNGKYKESYRFLKEFRTSADPNAVGSMADLFIGRSTNMYFTETNNLKILPKSLCIAAGLDHLGETELADPGSAYTLGIRRGFAASGDTSATTFIYSQDHIVKTLIPSYRKLIFNLLANSPDYESQLPVNHPFYGMANDMYFWEDSTHLDSIHPSYIFNGEPGKMDSIGFLNEQISAWVQTLAINEALKANGEAELIENISFDAVAGAYSNEVTETETDIERNEITINFKWFYGSLTGFNIMGSGVTLYSKSTSSYDRSLAAEEEKAQDITWGYILEDHDQGDYYSIDVKRDKMAGGDYLSSDEFLNEDNLKEAFSTFSDIIDYIDIMCNITDIGSEAISMVVKRIGKIYPLAGQFIGMGISIGQYIGYSRHMKTFRSDIENKEINFDLNGTSPFFIIRGGQSRCPAEGEERTSFFLDTLNNFQGYLLHIGTQAHEAPAINIEPAVVVNVPASKPAVFILKLTNESPTDKDLTYILKVDEASNPNGAIIKLDGLNPNRPFFIPAGTTLTKTLTVEKGATSKMDFENLQLILHSSCQYNPDDHYFDIADSVSFSVHFLPTCSEVEFGNLLNNWVLNDSYNDTMMIELKGYDINHTQLNKLLFQYAKPGYTPTTAMTFYKNEDDYNIASEPKTWLQGNASVNYNWPVNALTDGIYELQLKSVCYDGSAFQTNKLTGVIDRILPRPFGVPEPADGILSTGENISIMFNEEIDAGNLYVHKDYISLTGMLNGTDLTTQKELLHDVSLHFDGNGQNVTVPAGISLEHTPFTIEFWAKRLQTGQECIISQGDPDIGGLWIGFDATDHFIMKMAGITVTSDNTYGAITGQWCHFACVFNNGIENTNKGITLIIATASATEEKYQTVTADYTQGGSFIMGNCVDGYGFTGYLQHVRLWNAYRTLSETTAQRYQLLTGYEKDLVGYWPMDDAAGNIARELASAKNGIVSATWSVSRDNKAISLDGTGHIEFGTGTMVFNRQSDFTIEFWFKAGAQDACLLSNGKADGTDGYVSNWAILTHSSGGISVMNHGKQVFNLAPGYLNNQWHHLAMVIDRQSSARLYMDGDLKITSTVSGLSGFGAAKATLGARWWYDPSDFLDHFDMLLTGCMDEIRIWNSARKQNLISENMFSALSGQEYGLKAYFPFENVNVTDPSVSVNTLANSTLDNIGAASDCMLSTGANHTGEAPTIKLSRPVVSIPFNYVINADKVIIEPNIEPALIENQILTLSIRNVSDLHNNKMASTVTWTAFIDVNSLVWEKSEVSLVKKPDEEKEFTVRILNKGGQKEYFTINNYPEWLEVSDDHGAIEPTGSKEIKFTLFPGMNPGQYTANLYLSGNLGFNERLQIQVSVKAEPPDWKVNASKYEYSMSLIGQLKIDETLSTDVNDLIGAFNGQECVGVANVTYFSSHDIYLVFMDIYGNSGDEGKNIHLKVWDSDKDRVYPEVTPVIAFSANSMVGTSSNPKIIHALNQYSFSRTLANGWSWVSFNLSGKLNNLDSLFMDLSLSEGNMIKGQNAYDIYCDSSHSWRGTLSQTGGLNVTSMYMMKLSQEQSFTYSGQPVSTGNVPISLTKDWNWIGYTPLVNMTVKEAFGYHLPTAGDLVKSQNGFAIYDDLLGWIGSLQYMKPGSGYLYYSGKEGNFYYPEGSKLKGFIQAEAEMPVQDFAYKWPYNMSIIARIVPEGRVNENYSVSAYQNNLITGNGTPVFISSTGEWLWFIQVFGDDAQKNEIFFTVENADRKYKLGINEKLSFRADNLIGTLSNPVLLTLESELEKNSLIKVFPNPFTDALYISGQTRDFSRIDLIDIGGRVLFNFYFKPEKDPVTQKLNLPKELEKGIYFLKIIGIDGIQYIKIIKQ